LATVSRARASNVATIVFASAHGCQVGDPITVTGLNAGATASYNVEGVTVASVSTTTVANDTLTYANTAANEGTTADTAGRVFNHRVRLGTTTAVSKVSTISHSIDGKLADKVSTLTLDSVKLAIRPVATLTQNLDSDSQTYPMLGTIWGGNRTLYGPRMGGDKRWRIIDTQTTKVLNLGDNSENLANLNGAGYIAWDSQRMWAAALVMKALMPAGGGMIAQDRSPSSVGTDKMYNRYTNVNAIIPAGTIITGGYDRYDTKRTSGDPLLVD